MASVCDSSASTIARSALCWSCGLRVPLLRVQAGVFEGEPGPLGDLLQQREELLVRGACSAPAADGKESGAAVPEDAV